MTSADSLDAASSKGVVTESLSRWQVSFELLQDACVPEGPPQSNIVTSMDHLPVSVVRGALASVWIRENGLPSGHDSQEEFADLFERGGIRLGPALPKGHFVVPMYAARCKYQPGNECATTLVDSRQNPLGSSTCPHCQGPLEFGKGEIRSGLGGSRPRLSRRTRLEVEDGRGTAVEGGLFSEESIPAGTTLVAESRCDPRGAQWLRGLDAEEVWVGANRSTQGMATVRTSEKPRESAGDNGGDLINDEGARDLIVLAAPAVILDQFGCATAQPTAAMLFGNSTDAHIEAQWIRHTVVSGWHAASGLPRPAEVGLTAGSAFEVSGLTEEERRVVRDQGIGTRTAEGLGAAELNPSLPVVEVGRQVGRASPDGGDAGLPHDLSWLEGPDHDSDRRWLAKTLKKNVALVEESWGTDGATGDELFDRVVQSGGSSQRLIRRRAGTHLTELVEILRTTDGRLLENYLLQLARMSLDEEAQA